MGRTEAAVSRVLAGMEPSPKSGELPIPGEVAIRVLSSDDDHAVGTFGRTFVMIWRRNTVISAARSVHSGIVSFARKQERIGVITLIEERASLPPPESRKVLAALMNDVEPYVIRSAVICEGTGFRAAAFRAASTGIALLANYSFQHRVFAQIEFAGAWLAKGLGTETGEQLRVQQISEAVATIRGPRST